MKSQEDREWNRVAKLSEKEITKQAKEGVPKKKKKSKIIEDEEKLEKLVREYHASLFGPS